MKIRKVSESETQIELQMTPMIDIVFQLLVFFIMTFKIVPQEGDFNIRMPLAAPSQASTPESFLPLRVRLTQNPDGTLGGISVNEQAFRDFTELREYVISYLSDAGGPEEARDEVEVEIDADYGLHYEYVVRTITAVYGYRDKATGRIVKLVGKIKFAPPDQPPAQ